MIDNNVIWRGVPSLPENIAASQGTKGGASDSAALGVDRSIVFEAYILEKEGVSERAVDTTGQSREPASYSQARGYQQTELDGPGGEPSNATRSPGTKFDRRSGASGGNGFSFEGSYGESERAGSGNGGPIFDARYSVELAESVSSPNAVTGDRLRNGISYGFGANVGTVADPDGKQVYSCLLSNDGNDSSNGSAGRVSVSSGRGGNRVDPAIESERPSGGDRVLFGALDNGTFGSGPQNGVAESVSGLAMPYDAQRLLSGRAGSAALSSTTVSSGSLSHSTAIRGQKDHLELATVVGASRVREENAELSRDAGVPAVGVSVFGRSANIAPPVTPFQRLDNFESNHGRTLAASATSQSVVKSEPSLSVTGRRESESASPTLSIGNAMDFARQNHDTAAEFFGTDWVPAAGACAQSLVPSISAIASGIGSGLGLNGFDNANAIDGIYAGSAATLGVSANGAGGRGQHNGEKGIGLADFYEQSDAFQVKQKQKLWQKLTETAGSGSESDSTEALALAAVVPMREELAGSASNGSNLPSIGLSVIGQSVNFAPPATSFQTNQFASRISGQEQTASATFQSAVESSSSRLPPEQSNEVNASTVVSTALADVSAGELGGAARSSVAGKADLRVIGGRGITVNLLETTTRGSVVQPRELKSESAGKFGMERTIDVKEQVPDESEVQMVGPTVSGQSVRVAPLITSSQMQYISTPISERGQAWSPAIQSAGELDLAAVAAGHLEKCDVSARSIDAEAGQAWNASKNLSIADRSPGADTGALKIVTPMQDFVSHGAAGASSVARAQNLDTPGDTSRSERAFADGKAMFAVSEIAQATIVRPNDDAGPAIIGSQGEGGVEAAIKRHSAGQESAEAAGRGSQADSSDKPGAQPDIQPSKEQLECVPNVDSAKVIGTGSQQSNVSNLQTIGLSLIGQSGSLASSVTSAQMQQIARPILEVCRAETSRNAAEGSGASFSAPPLVKTLEIRLDAESLGVVMVKMRLSGEALEIQIATDHQKTLDILRDNKEVLSQSLQSSGYKVDAMSLQASADQAGSGGRQASPGLGHHVEFQSSGQGSSLGSPQQGEYRSRDQSRLEKGSEGQSEEALASHAQETGLDGTIDAVYV